MRFQLESEERDEIIANLQRVVDVSKQAEQLRLQLTESQKILQTSWSNVYRRYLLEHREVKNTSIPAFIGPDGRLNYTIDASGSVSNNIPEAPTPSEPEVLSEPSAVLATPTPSKRK